jgi:hypothetical protein
MTQKPLPKAASPEHLNGALRKFGSLANVRVCDVVVESSHATILSEITRLRPIYDGEASGAPRTIILKTGRPDRLGDANWDAGRQEEPRLGKVCRDLAGRGHNEREPEAVRGKTVTFH